MGGAGATGPDAALSLRVREAWADATVQRILKMAPATLGVSVAQISLLINTNIATGDLQRDRARRPPDGIPHPRVALSTVLLPSLSAANARDDHASYSALLDWGLRLLLLPPRWAWPCCRTGWSPRCFTTARSRRRTWRRRAWP